MACIVARHWVKALLIDIVSIPSIYTEGTKGLVGDEQGAKIVKLNFLQSIEVVVCCP